MHSRISPSSAGVWSKCPGSVSLKEKHPRTGDTEAAREGTAAHEMAADMLLAALRGGVGDLKVGDTASNGVVLTDEMRAGAKVYADTVMEEARDLAAFGGGGCGIERQVSAPSVHAESFGTVDSFLWSENKGRLFVCDYKFGRRPVGVFENMQLINYLAAIMDELNLHGKVFDVTFCVVQPRLTSEWMAVRKFTAPISDCLPLIAKLKLAAELIYTGPAMCTTGDHCRYCSGKISCIAAQRVAAEVLEVTESPMGQHRNLTNSEVATQLAWLERAEESVKFMRIALEESVYSRIQSGELIPGYRLTPSRGSGVWTKPVSELETLGSLVGAKLTKSVAITPKQARDAGVPAEIVASCSERHSKMVVTKDSGEAARLIFNK